MFYESSQSILRSLLQALDVTDLFSTNSRFQIPQRKKVRDASQRNEQDIVFIHLICSVVPETSCSRIPEEPQDVVKYQSACTINKSHCADSHFVTVLEGLFLTNLGKRSGQTWWKRFGDPDVCLMPRVHGTLW